MKKINLFVLLIALKVSVLYAQSDAYVQDVAAIKQMCGCYEVDFAFAETFAPDADYTFHDRYHARALEWVELLEEAPGKLVLQHLLIINDSTVIKHWRQDWLYEHTNLLAFDKNARWVPYSLSHKEVQGTWTQKVYQVDDSPRYEGYASWIHQDGRHYWESAADAPLPRRDYTKRDDYNVMNRRNRHEITSTGWVHEQDNKKLIRTDEGDQLLVNEKGLNSYTLVPASRCQVAQDWWVANGAPWASVRQAWDKITAEGYAFTMVPKVDGKRFSTWFKEAGRAEAEELVRKFVVQERAEMGGTE